MDIKKYFLVFLTLIVAAIPVFAQSQNESAQSREYKIKAAFLYNFLKFVDWPEDKENDNNNPILIGIIGKDIIADAFEPVKDKKVKNKNTVIKTFKSFEELKKIKDEKSPEFQDTVDALRKCHLLFICSSEKNNLVEIIDLVKNNSVLTVGETSGMLKTGGIINFLLEENKVRFEVNLVAAKQSKLTIRSQLLRLAKQVIEEKS